MQANTEAEHEQNHRNANEFIKENIERHHVNNETQSKVTLSFTY